ncbi:N5-glutamine methyltransferase family protein [Niabella ginsengisoli]|uniref:Methyltransferase n=1 Tax=Niabella ginsengisoli TaxID=522298 RepID=A0ABS9SHR7_9BACT|nr:methyltransferase [Niabella ginsengisoli]MCH5597916.1 methyltransferase [Niabella ginsengisoli]
MRERLYTYYLKRKLPFADIISCDISKAALNIAQKNARKHKTEITFLNLDFLDKSTWSQIPEVDIIVSNPPYIPQQDKVSMHHNVLQYEPHEALFVADNEPLIFYSAIANCAKTILKPEGKLYVEVYEGLGNDTKQLFEDCGYTSILKMDMQGKNRMLKACPVEYISK